MTTRGFFDADGHVYELDISDLSSISIRRFAAGRSLLRQPLINSGDGWHRIALGVGQGPRRRDRRRNYRADRGSMRLDEVGLDGTVLHPTLGAQHRPGERS